MSSGTERTPARRAGGPFGPYQAFLPGKNLGPGGRMQKQGTKKEGRLFRRPSFLEQVKGVEPSYQAWEACVLPMNYTCVSMFS